MLNTVWASLRQVLSGRRLTRAVERNESAARELDAALREVLGQ